MAWTTSINVVEKSDPDANSVRSAPAENWLPSGGKDENLDVIMRVYAPDIEAMKTWQAPKAEKQ